MLVMLFDYYTGVQLEPSNLWVDMIYSVAEFKMKVLEELLRVLSPNRRIFVTAVLLDSKMILFICSEGSIFRLLVWQWSRFIIKNSQHQSAGMRKLMIYDGELSLCHLKF